MSHLVDTSEPQLRPRYLWPWFVLAAVLLGIVLAAVWVGKEAARTRTLRQWNAPSAPIRSNTAPARAH